MSLKILVKTILISLVLFGHDVEAKDHQNDASNDQSRQLIGNIFGHRDEDADRSIFNDSMSIPCTIKRLFGVEFKHDKSLKNYLTCATKDGQFFDATLVHGLSSLYDSLTPDEELIINLSKQAGRRHNFQLVGHMNDFSFTRRQKKEDQSKGLISSRNFSTQTTSGIFKLLVVRVLGRGVGDVVTQSEAKLYNDFFGDSGNVRTTMMKCSNNKLIVNPARGDQVNQGVLTVRLDQNLNGIDFLMVSSSATAEVRSRNNMDYTHIAFVMPQTVNFRGSVAFGEQPGTVSWYQTDFASNAFIQVHEIGHNLGFNHSGKGSNEFGDSIDSLGDIGQWADDGPVACFNGAKTYYSGWYPEYYSSLDPGMNSYSADVVGLNDIVSEVAVSKDNDLVLKLSTVGSDDLFIMYQRAEGILDTLQSNRDTVTITQQKSFEAQSWSLAELRPGQQYRYENYGRYGRSLVVKFCSEIVDNHIDKAHVIAYVEGLTEASCGAYMEIPDDEPSCSDTPLDFMWRRQRRNCDWVATKATKRCSFKALSSMCPQTCLTCDTCVDGRKRFYMKNFETSRACYWASSRNTLKRCKIFGIAESCRETCGQCS